MLPKVDFSDVRKQVETAYKATVAGIFPNSDEMMELASSDLFILRYPDHSLSKEMRLVASQIHSKPQDSLLKNLFNR